MAEHRQRNAAIWISSVLEGAYNDLITVGANYIKARTQNPQVLLPALEKENDAGTPGNGHAHATFVCNRYWLPLALDLDFTVDFDLPGRLLLRALSGAVTDTELSPGAAHLHEANMLAPGTGLQLKSFNVISALGGASYLCSGGVVSSFRLGQDGAAPPRYQANILTSGKHKSPHGVTSLPAAPTPLCPRSKVQVQWTDSGGLRDFTVGCKLRSWFCELLNNPSPTDDRCASDPEQAAGDPAVLTGPSVAAYLQKLTQGDPTVNAQITVLLDDTLPEWVKMAENEELTDVTFSVLGPELAPTFPARLTMIIPRAVIGSMAEVDSNGRAALQMNILPLFDDTTQGVLTGQVVNGLTGVTPDYN